MSANHWNGLKWFFLSISVGSVLLAFFFMWVAPKPTLPEQGGQASDSQHEGARTEIERPWMVERKGDRVLWRLQAQEADQQLDGMHLMLPQLELFTKGGERVPVASKKAHFKPIKKDFKFMQDVVAKYRGWTLQTNTLIYKGEDDLLRTPEKFRLQRQNILMRGRTMLLNHAAEKVSVEHDVWIQDTGSASRDIKSQALNVDHGKRRAEFIGEVVVNQGDAQLRCDRLLVFYRMGSNNDIDRLEAYGHVRMQQGNKRGSADKAVYEQDENLLTLIDHAELFEDGNVLRGERIEYNLQTEETRVTQGKDGERVRLVIEDEEPSADQVKP